MRARSSSSALALAGASLAVLIALAIPLVDKFPSAVSSVAGGLAGLIVGILSARAASRTSPKRVQIALVGAPRVGKTVYVTALFDYLQTSNTGTLGFAPSAETADRIGSSLNSLREGNVMAATPGDYLYLYSASIAQRNPPSFSRLVGARRYKLEVADVAGEKLQEFEPGAQAWSARSSFYNYATESDAIFAFIDSTALLGRSPEASAQLGRNVNEIIFVIQAACDRANVGPTDKLQSPVALLFSKFDETGALDESRSTWDYTAKQTKNAMLEQPDLARLLSVMQARCRWFDVFPVSSTGPGGIGEDGQILLRPYGVAEPLMWVLSTRFGLRSRSSSSTKKNY